MGAGSNTKKTGLFLGLLVAIPFFWGCSTLKNWSEKYSSDNSSSAKSKKQFSIQESWVRSTLSKENEGFRKINRMSPLLSDSLVIQGNAVDGVVALDQNSGRLVWKKPFQEGVESSGLIYREKVYLATSDGQVLSVDLKTGQTLWTVSTKSENLAQPLIDSSSGTLFILAGNNVVHALDAENGRTLWIYSRQDTSSFSIRGGPQPLLKDGLLYVGFSEGSFVALNAKSGTVAWEIRLNKNKRFRDIDASAVLDQDRIYISGFDDKLYALSLKGEILWRVEEGGYSAVKVQNEQLFYATTSGKVLGLNKIDGKIIWTYKLKDGLATQVQFYKGLIAFGESQGSLVFLNSQDGALVGSFEPGRGIMATPSIDEVKSRIYFISGEANLYSLDIGWKNTATFEYLK